MMLVLVVCSAWQLPSRDAPGRGLLIIVGGCRELPNRYLPNSDESDGFLAFVNRSVIIIVVFFYLKKKETVTLVTIRRILI